MILLSMGVTMGVVRQLMMWSQTMDEVTDNMGVVTDNGCGHRQWVWSQTMGVVTDMADGRHIHSQSGLFKLVVLHSPL